MLNLIYSDKSPSAGETGPWSVSAVCHGCGRGEGDTRAARVQGCPSVIVALVTISSAIAGSLLVLTQGFSSHFPFLVQQ